MRIRTMKPEFFSDPAIGRVSIPARLLLLSLLTQADDEGRLRHNHLQIRAAAFAEQDEVDVPALLRELEQAGRIHLYQVDDERFVAVHNFNRHQNINRPRPSAYPPPPLTEPSVSPQCALSEGSLEEWNGTGNGTGNREHRTRKRAVRPQCAFPDGWQYGSAEAEVATRHRVKDAEREFARFTAHHQAKGSTFASWSAAWVTWCLNAVRFNGAAPEPVKAADLDDKGRLRLPKGYFYDETGAARWRGDDRA